MCFIPLSEWGSVDLNDGGFGEGVGADQFVVGGMVGHDDHTDFTGDTLGSPGKVTGVETETAEFLVSTTAANDMDSLGSNTGVGWLTTLLERSVERKLVRTTAQCNVYSAQ